jgi:hypothetical protein
MVRQILAVIAGYITAAGTVRIAQGILFFMIFPPLGPGPAPGEGLPASYFVGLLVFAIVAAILGGHLAAAIGRTQAIPRFLGLVILAMGALTAIVDNGRQPLWFGVLLPAAGAVVAFVSATRWLRRQPSSL